MLVRIYEATWMIIVLFAGLLFITGYLTPIVEVAFGLVIFGLVFAGMMFVLPVTMKHPELAPIASRANEQRPALRKESEHHVALPMH